MMTTCKTTTDTPVADIFRTLWGFMGTQAMYAASRLGVFDALGDDTLPAGALAHRCDCHEASLARLLRFLASLDVLHETADGEFSLTSTGHYLRADHPASMRALSLLYGQPSYWQSWGALHDAVKTGQSAFEHVSGVPFFDYLATHAEEAGIFNAAMEEGSRIHLRDILDAYDFSGLARIVDIGGGSGALLQGILAAHPGVTGVLFDLPATFAQASEAVSFAHPGMERVAGDMFDAVPAGADAYVLKRILHDWNDDEVLRILRNCRAAMPAHGRLLVIEAVLRPPNRPDPARWMDLNMLVLLSGRERTADEFSRLLEAAGLTLTRVLATTRMSILEAIPAEAALGRA